MEHERCSPEETRMYTDEELDLVEEFMELERAGAGPSIDGFLARLPGSANRLRPVLEGAQVIAEQVRELRREHPGMGLAFVVQEASCA